MENANTLGILQQLERGEISAGEADARLSAPLPIERADIRRGESLEIPGWARQIWFYTLAGGVLLVLFGAWIIAATARANALWLIFGVPIVLLGTLVLAIAASAQAGHWLCVNIESSRRRRTIRLAIPFSMGLIRLALWIVKHTARHPRARVAARVSHAKFDLFWEDPDEFLDALERELTDGRSLTIEVADSSERVQVYIV